jgi:hypothetical protein
MQVDRLWLLAQRVRRVPWWACALFASCCALTLRILGIRLGLPFFHHWDEVWVVRSTTHILQSRDAEPDSYMYGAPLSLLSAGLFRVLQALEPARMLDPGDPVLGRLLGRSVTVLISSSGAFAVYVAARHAAHGERAGRLRGIYAALLYATAAELVSHGRYAVTDADLTALVAWSLACTAIFLNTGSLWAACGTILFAGLAFAFKVTALPALAIPALTLVLRSCDSPSLRRRWVERAVGVVAVPAAGLIFVILNPHVLIHWQAAFADITARAQQTVLGGVPAFLLREPGLDHLGAVLEGLAVRAFHRAPLWSALAAAGAGAGLVAACSSRNKLCLVAVAHAAVSIGAIALTSRSYLFRNYLVAIPALCIGFGWTMASLHARLARLAHTHPRLGPSLTACLSIAFATVYVAFPFAQAVETARLSEDARIRAIDWIANRSRPGATLSVAGTPRLVGGDGDGSRDDYRRPGVALLNDLVKTPDEARRTHADYLVVASENVDGDRDSWPFEAVPGYRPVARFEANPFEHNFAITATWAGNVNALVLERIQ